MSATATRSAAGLGSAAVPGRIAVLVMTVVTIAMNTLANVLPLAGRTTGEISDAFPALVTPAGYVFSIWGVIYLGLLAYAVWQALPGQAGNRRVAAVAWPIVVGHVANSLWIVAWHNLAFGATQVLMLVLLGSLIVVYLRLRARSQQRGDTPPSRVERLVARGTFSVYLGWITVATVANTTIWLMDLGWDGGFVPAAVWAALTLVVATALGVRMLRVYRDAAYAAVLMWAFVGIVVMQIGTVLVAATAVLGVVTLAYVAALTFRGPERGEPAGAGARRSAGAS